MPELATLSAASILLIIERLQSLVLRSQTALTGHIYNKQYLPSIWVHRGEFPIDLFDFYAVNFRIAHEGISFSAARFFA